MKKKFFSLIASAAILLGGAGMAACGPAGHEHVWNGGEVTVQPSCKNEGVKTFKCTVRSGRHDDIRNARPDRGDDYGFAHSRNEGRIYPADRRA